MAKFSLAGFKDPVRRPRFIVNTFVGVFGLAAVAVLMLGATSTRAFCANGMCHKVQADTIGAYAASPHSEVSCIACHEPVNADAGTFVLAKVNSALEVIPTLGNTFTFPLNAGSALALKGGREMGSQQCTQCHSSKREVTPSGGILIDHNAHAEAGVWCTVCHNRVAHRDQVVPPVLVAPNGTKNVAHADFLRMDYCFRCHDLEGTVKMTGAGAKAVPGACPTCHTAGFDLFPDSHKAAGWPGAPHAKRAKQILADMAVAAKEAKALEAEGVAPYLAAPVNECSTCHVESTFCAPCHTKMKVTTAG